MVGTKRKTYTEDKVLPKTAKGIGSDFKRFKFTDASYHLLCQNNNTGLNDPNDMHTVTYRAPRTLPQSHSTADTPPQIL